MCHCLQKTTSFGKATCHNIRLISCVIFILVIFSVNIGKCEAGVYYVSPNGTANWAACIVQNTPCSVSTAMSNAVAGDTVYFLDGIYKVTMTGSYLVPVLTPSNSGTASNPITFKSLNQYGANIHGTGTSAPLAQASASMYVSTMIGSYQKNYITWDGFKLTARNYNNTADIFAMARFQNTTGCKIINCELIGGTHSSGGAANSAGIFMENTTYLTIENNRIHGYKESSNNPNNGGIEGYDSSFITVTNNEIYDTTCGIHFKDNIDDSIINNNYIHHNYVGIVVRNINANGACERNTISNNVIANNSYEGIEIPHNGLERANYTTINNNTFYKNTSVAIEMGETNTGAHPKIYNNIISGSLVSLNIKGITNQIAECDHNQWTSTFKIVTHKYESNSKTYTSLASWQSSGELQNNGNPGVEDLASDPSFKNTSGGFNQLDDFHLSANSPCAGTGRNGMDIGADISQVGIRKFLAILPPSNVKITVFAAAN